MTTTEFTPGLAGVVAFETEIAEPDKEGGELRYRGVNIEDLVDHVPFEQVWGWLVDEAFEPGLPAAHQELELRTGHYIGDLQTALAATASSIGSTRAGAPPWSGPESAPTADDSAAAASAPVEATIRAVNVDAFSPCSAAENQ